jgi:hypothetical protein
MTADNSEIDLTFFEAQPPRMVDDRNFPPPESSRGNFGHARLDAEAVQDPGFPWETMAHDSAGGAERREAVRAAKQAQVSHYVLVHAKLWRQFATPQFYPGERTETVGYTVGRSSSKSRAVERDIEVQLGLKGEVLSLGVKGSLKWTSRVEESFSEVHTSSVTQKFAGNHWYFFWQTIDELSLYRARKDATDVLEQVRVLDAPSGVVMMDSHAMPDRIPGPLLRAGAVKLKKGESTSFGGWVFANTKVYAKNLSDNDDGEATISWAGLGGKILMPLKPGQTKSVEKYLPFTFKVISSGVTQIEVWTA